MQKQTNTTLLQALVALLFAAAVVGYLVVQKPFAGTKQATARTQPPAAAQGSDAGSHHGAAAADSAQFNDLLGKPLPDITLKDKDGTLYSAESFAGKITVLFFNEGAMCFPSCWKQIVEFGNDPRFNGEGVQVVAVMVDSPEEWQQSAVRKMPELADVLTLFDTELTASAQLGVLSVESSMHKGQYPGHSYLIVDAAGVVRYVFDDPNMGINNDRLFEEIQALSITN